MISERIKSLESSKSMAIADLARKLKASGKQIIDLSSGEPHFDTPLGIKHAAIDALKKNKTHYTSAKGIAELREAISRKLKRKNNLNYDFEDEIIVTPGAKQAIFYTLFSLLERGDEVIIIEPYWLSYRDMVKLAGGKIVSIKACIENKFKPTYDAISSKITKRTKIILINTPSNPTGVVWEKNDLKMISKIANEHDLVVISDEVYEDIIFDDKKHYSIATFPGMKDRTISIYSFSKCFAMTGWRIGYMAGPKEVLEHVVKIQQHTATCANSLSQYAGLYAISNESKSVGKFRTQLKKNRDIVFDAISKSDKLFTIKTEGTFYSFVNITKTGMNSQDACKYILEKFGVATVPGTAYGESGEGYIRLSFAISTDELIKAMNLLKNI